MEKVFGEYWIINKVSSLGGEKIVTETLNFTTKEKADEYYKEHLDENSWYEHMNPPALKVIKVNFID
jgi:hypothetical protein